MRQIQPDKRLFSTIVGYLWRFYGEKRAWSDEELSTLKALYPHAPRRTILKALPQRTWHNIKCYGYKYGIKRIIDSRQAPFHKHWTWEDYQVIEQIPFFKYGFGETVHAVWESFNATTLSTVYTNKGGEL